MILINQLGYIYILQWIYFYLYRHTTFKQIAMCALVSSAWINTALIQLNSFFTLKSAKSGFKEIITQCYLSGGEERIP